MRLLWRAYERFHSHKGPDRAAAVAYYTLLSLIPLLVFLISLAAWLFGSHERATGAALLLLRGVLDQLDAQAQAQLQTFVRSTLRLQLPGIVLLAWTARCAFRTLISAVETVFGVPARGFARGNLLAVGMVLLAGAALLATLTTTATLATTEGLLLRLAPRSAPHLQGLTALLLTRAWPILITFGFFFMLYRLVPRRVITTRHALAGAALATVLWECARTGFSLYVRHIARYAGLYGALEAIVVLALWLELSASIILYGGEVVALLLDERPKSSSAPAAPAPSASAAR